MVFEVVEIALHLRIRPTCERIVAVLFVIEVGHLDNRAPPRAGTPAAPKIGGGVLDVPGFRILAVEDVADPLAVEGLRVGHGHKRERGELSVAGVAQPLDMRAVGRNAGMQVAELGMERGPVDPVQHIVVGFKTARHGKIGVDELDRQRLGVALDREVAETEPGEVGRDDGAGFALDFILLFEVVIGIGHPVLRTLLREENRGKPLFPEPKNRDPRQILAGVVDLDPVALAKELGDDGLDHAVGGTVGQKIVGLDRFGKRRVRKPALVEVGREDRGIEVGPVLEFVGRELVVDDVAGGDQVLFRRNEVALVGFDPPDRLGVTPAALRLETVTGDGVPAAAETDRDQVVARRNEVGDIVFGDVEPVSRQRFARGIVLPRLVVGKQRQKAVVGDLFAVDKTGEEAEPRHAEDRLPLFLQFEMAAQNGEAGLVFTPDELRRAEHLLHFHRFIFLSEWSDSV